MVAVVHDLNFAVDAKTIPQIVQNIRNLFNRNLFTRYSIIYRNNYPIASLS